MNVTAINMPETVSAALLVMAGKFGNGEERKAALARAGYDPARVQACVNDLVPVFDKYKGVK